MAKSNKNLQTTGRSKIAAQVGGVIMLAGVFFGVGMSLVSPPIGLAILLGGLVVGGIIVAISTAIGGTANFKGFINWVKNGTLLATDDEQPSAALPKNNKERNRNNEHGGFNIINHADLLESQTPEVLPQQTTQKEPSNFLSIFSIFNKKSNLGDAEEKIELKTDEKQRTTSWRTYFGFGKQKEN